MKVVSDVEKCWQEAPTRKQILAEKDGKWWKPMEELIHRSDFGAYRLPIIPRDAVEEKFEQLEPEEQAALAEINKTVDLKSEDN